MSYFEDEERKICEQEKEQAEIEASNERQKELDEKLPHIEKLEDGSWIGSIDFSVCDEVDFEAMCQNLFESMKKQDKKNETETKLYQVMRFKKENIMENTITLYVKLQHIEKEE